MAKELVKIQEQGVPGLGVSGLVLCPFFRSACLKGGCELWVELLYDGKPVGRCAFPWNSKLLIELRESTDRLSAVMEKADGKKPTKKED